MTADELRAALADAGSARDSAERDRQRAMTTIARLVIAADGVLSTAEVARLAGVTRQTVYDLRRAHAAS